MQQPSSVRFPEESDVPAPCWQVHQPLVSEACVADPQVAAITRAEASELREFWTQQETVLVENEMLEERIKNMSQMFIKSGRANQDLAAANQEAIRELNGLPRRKWKTIEASLTHANRTLADLAHDTGLMEGITAKLQNLIQDLEEPQPRRGGDVFDFWANFKAFHDMVDDSCSTEMKERMSPSSDVPLLLGPHDLDLETEDDDDEDEGQTAIVVENPRRRRSKNINGSKRAKRRRDRAHEEAARIAAVLEVAALAAPDRVVPRQDSAASSSQL